MNQVQKAIHVITTNRPGRWKSINLSNMALELSLEQLQGIERACEPVLLAAAIKRYDELEAEGAPALILEWHDKPVQSAKRNKHPCLAPIRARINKLKRGEV